MTAPRDEIFVRAPLDYVQRDRCPRCDGDRIMGEPGWRCCTECEWDELPASRKAAESA